MKIQNKKTEVSTSIELNDKDLLNRLNSTLKELVKAYATVLTEASNESLYKEYKKHFEEYIKLQRETYELMFENGWYQLETAEKNKIQGKYVMLENEFANLAMEE